MSHSTIILLQQLIRDVVRLLLRSRVRVLPHGVQWVRKQVIHGLETAALELWQDEPEDDDAEPSAAAKEKEGSIAQAAHHVRDSRCDTVGNEPFKAKA